MLVIKEKEKPKQGRIQRGFVKGGMGGRWYQSTSERNFQLQLFFLVQLTRRNLKIVLQLPQHGARALARAIWLVFEKFTSAGLSQIAREKPCDYLC